MVKLEVIHDFTLVNNPKYKFEDLKSIIRKGKEEKNKLFKGDIIECTEEMATYLTQKVKHNDKEIQVTEVRETIPEEKKEKTIKKTTTKKTTKKSTKKE